MDFLAQPNLPDLINYSLVAPRIKVLYVPTTKVACSTLKLLISQAEGSYNAQATQEIITPNISQEQTIHNYRVHGLTRLFDLPRKKQWEVIESSEWMRVAALRDPIKRAYSSWENRVFLHAPGTPQSILDMCSDVMVDGHVDVAATFKKFARAIHNDRVAFAIDDHFRPQFNTLYANQLEYHHRIYIDRPGEMQALADALMLARAQASSCNASIADSASRPTRYLTKKQPISLPTRITKTTNGLVSSATTSQHHPLHWCSTQFNKRYSTTCVRPPSD